MFIFFFKQKTAYDMLISDWSSDVCSSDLIYFVAVIVAAIGALLAPTTAQGLSVLVTPTIAVLMYAMFLQIPFLKLREGLRNKSFMAALLVANFVLIPLLVWVLTRFLEGHPAILVGVLLEIGRAHV